MVKPSHLGTEYPYLNNVTMDPRLLGLHAGLIPFLQFVSSPRVDMWSSHSSQAMALKHGQFPFIYSGPEQNFGEYEFRTDRRDQDVDIIKVIPKYPPVLGDRRVHNNPSLTVVYVGREDGLLNYFTVDSYTKCSDGFGYENTFLNQHLLSLTEGQQYLPKETQLVTSPIHKDGVYCLGANANIAFMTSEDTIEDAMAISRSFANKLTTAEIRRERITIEANYHPLNLYGDDTEFKFLPDIGERVGENGILCAFRTINTETFVPDLIQHTLTQPQALHDAIFYAKPGSKILDFDVQMARSAKVSKYLYAQVEKYTYLTTRYWQEIIDVHQRYKKTHKLAHAFQTHVTEAIEHLAAAGVSVPDFPRKTKVKLIGKNNRQVEFIQITVTYMSERPCSNGFKITGRDGAKGVIGRIVEDADMPVDDYGFRADVLIDPASVFARMNLGQIYEQAINRTSEFVRRRVESTLSHQPEAAVEMLFDYYNDINPNYAELIRGIHSTPQTMLHHTTNAVRNGIYLHIPPGLETIGLPLIGMLRKKWDVKLSPVTFTQRDIEGNIIGTFRTKKSVCIGSKYIYLLCKIPEPSSPGVAHINQYNTPMKASPHDRIRHPIRQSPIRFGEDEVRMMLMDVKDSQDIVRLMCLQANSTQGVNALIERMLTDPHPTRIPRIDISNTDLMNSNTIVRIFRHMMATIGVGSTTIGPVPLRESPKE